MTNATIREQLCRQIDDLPDDLVEQVADFALFLMMRQHITPKYADWKSREWRAFSLEQLFREDDEVEYSLKDAQEIYHP